MTDPRKNLPWNHPPTDSLYMHTDMHSELDDLHEEINNDTPTNEAPNTVPVVPPSAVVSDLDEMLAEAQSPEIPKVVERAPEQIAIHAPTPEPSDHTWMTDAVESVPALLEPSPARAERTPAKPALVKAEPAPKAAPAAPMNVSLPKVKLTKVTIPKVSIPKINVPKIPRKALVIGASVVVFLAIAGGVTHWAINRPVPAKVVAVAKPAPAATVIAAKSATTLVATAPAVATTPAVKSPVATADTPSPSPAPTIAVTAPTPVTTPVEPASKPVVKAKPAPVPVVQPKPEVKAVAKSAPTKAKPIVKKETHAIAKKDWQDKANSAMDAYLNKH
jgi:hypothetical protein